MAEGKTTRGWVKVPEGGLSIDGVDWPAGPIELTDAAWLRMLKAAGAKEMTHEQYDAAKRGVAIDEAFGRRPAKRSKKAAAPAAA